MKKNNKHYFVDTYVEYLWRHLPRRNNPDRIRNPSAFTAADVRTRRLSITGNRGNRQRSCPRTPSSCITAAERLIRGGRRIGLLVAPTPTKKRGSRYERGEIIYKYFEIYRRLNAGVSCRCRSKKKKPYRKDIKK